MRRIAIDYDKQKLRDFCRRWRITEFSLFGSVVGDDFGPESDVDVLVSFAPDTHWTLFDMSDMNQELKILFDRDVDLLTRRAVEGSLNPIRKTSILSSAVMLDVA